jgi:hypothetical protein
MKLKVTRLGMTGDYMRKALIGIALLGLVGCATDYTNGGEVEYRDTPYEHLGVTIVLEFVTFADVIPGIKTDQRYRWVATNNSGEPRCVRVQVTSMTGDGGKDQGRTYLLQPGSGRQVVAYNQNAYGEAHGVGEAVGSIWRPNGSSCHR